MKGMYLALAVVSLVMLGCTTENATVPQEPSLVTVKIGLQVWMTRNLNVGRFRNGDSIPEAETTEEWIAAGLASQPAWCYYDHDPANGPVYGKLYNWYAVNDPRGLSPVGYHVASNDEWKTLIDQVGGYRNAGAALRSSTGWDMGNGSNSIGFWAMPAGTRDEDDFSHKGSFSVWWTASEHDSVRAAMVLMSAEDASTSTYNKLKTYGYSVRCVQD